MGEGRKMTTAKKQPLGKPAEAYIEGRDIVIRVPIASLPMAVKFGPHWPHAKVTDAEAFAKCLVTALNEDNHDGNPYIHRFFYEGIERAIESAADGVELDEEAKP
jgi:hypothetical protein